MKNMGILTKLTLGFGCVLLLTVILGGYVCYTLRSINTDSTATAHAFMPLVAKVIATDAYTTRGVTLLKDYFGKKEAQQYLDGTAEIHKARAAAVQARDIVNTYPPLAELAQYADALPASLQSYLDLLEVLNSTYSRYGELQGRLKSETKRLAGLANDLILSHQQGMMEDIKAAGVRQGADARMGRMHDMMALAESLGELRSKVDQGSLRTGENDAHSLIDPLSGLLAQVDTLESSSNHTECSGVLAALREGIPPMIDAVQEMHDIADRGTSTRGELRRLSASILQTIQSFSSRSISLTRHLAQRNSEATNSASRRVVLLMFTLLLGGVALVVTMARSLTAPLEQCVSYAERVAGGDLDASTDLDLDRQDEAGRLARAFNAMIHTIRARIDMYRSMQSSLIKAQTVTGLALSMAKAGAWTASAERPGVCQSTPQLNHILGLPEDTTQIPLVTRLAAAAAVNDEAPNYVREAYLAVFSGDKERNEVTYQVLRADTGQTLWLHDVFQATYGPLEDGGEGTLFLGITQDITEYMRQQEALEAATRAQNNFIANMSHEIRTPMNAIIGMGHLLRRTELTPLQHDYLSKVDSSAQLLLCLINDILDFSKINAGKMSMETIPFDVADMTARCRDTATGLLQSHNLVFTVQVAPNVPSPILGDPYRLQQVLNNLISNACKFTTEGSLTLIVEVEKGRMVRSEEEHWPGYLESLHSGVCLRFIVRDTGQGMTEEEQARLFKPFSQADNTITRKFGGTGLGLAICKHLTELMGGKISVASTPGQGSEFAFTAVFGLREEAEAQTVAPARAAACDDPFAVVVSPSRILLVEDNYINRLIAQEMLTAMGHAVDQAEDGQQAVAMAMETPYDMILMDIQMPVMDGLSAARAIRDSGGCNALAPIIAMTAHAMETDRGRSLEAGMNGHLTKPVDPAELRRTLDEWLRRTP